MSCRQISERLAEVEVAESWWMEFVCDGPKVSHDCLKFAPCLGCLSVLRRQPYQPEALDDIVMQISRDSPALVLLGHDHMTSPLARLPKCLSIEPCERGSNDDK
jgi:hypothetical protein